MHRSESDRGSIESDQLNKLRALIAALAPGNRFYSAKLAEAGLDGQVSDLNAFRSRMPFTTKDELLSDQAANPPYGTNLTHAIERYSRLSQSSATTDRTMRWLDTTEDWDWMLESWSRVLAEAGVVPGDRLYFAFSFGPFLGFWTAFEAALRRGDVLCIPGGGMSSAARLRVILDNGVTILCCTPTYAIRLGQVAAEQKIDLTNSKVRRIIVAGEPGGSLPATRATIERLWPNARVFDHHGMTEVGPVTFENATIPGVLHLIESAYLAEVVDTETQSPVAAGQIGELVLTTLGRTGSPLLRYRTSDLVRLSSRSAEELGSALMALEGGILGRTDDMVLIRGVNIYPSAVDQVVRRIEGIAEYRVEIDTTGSMPEMTIQIELEQTGSGAAVSGQLEKAMRDTFNLRVPVSPVAEDVLPRFEFKARRWVRVDG